METQEEKILIDKIVEFIKENPGKNAREISRILDIDKKDINQILYGYLRNQCAQSKNYGWYLKNAVPKEYAKINREQINTPLSKLCNYYSACIAEDKGADVSVFAESKYGLDYKEVDKLPLSADDESSLFSSSEVQGFLNEAVRDNSKKVYFGYPVVSMHIRSSKSNWDGYKLSPIFLFLIKTPESGGDYAEIDFNFPIINRNVVERFTGAKGEELMKEMVQIEEDLGISGDGEQPDLDDLAQRLKTIRPEWQWSEEVDPYNLSNDSFLSVCDKEGILNRAVVLRVTEAQNNYTRGLEYELSKLAEIPEMEYEDTALGQWVKRNIRKNEEKNLDSLLEVLPMNIEQRMAVEKALKNDLTVITGPPGTGKSQVVTNILINAAWQNKRVLFASKNNKAVDVVDIRINNIGNKPILLRMGSKNEYQQQLIKYIANLLSESADVNDKMEYEEKKKEYEDVQSKLLVLDSEEQDLIQLRNKVDSLDKDIDNVRDEFSVELFNYIRDADIVVLIEKFSKLADELSRVTKSEKSFLYKIYFAIFEDSIYKNIASEVSILKNELSLIEVYCPSESIQGSNIEEWSYFLERLKKRLFDISKIKNYFGLLKELQAAQSFEEIARIKDKLIKKMASMAESLWQLWLKVRTSNLSPEDRSLLSQYKTTLQMVSHDSPSKSAWRNYYEQSQRISHILPCWAVTSLSAKGRIPLRAGIFDLVVFDESSQCDIASALPLLYRAKQAVVIGDPNQLSHISAIPKMQDEKLLEKYGLIEHYSDWAYSYNSLYDLASGLTAGNDLIDLRDHYRSHADIINFSNSFFYGGHLRVATKYDSLKKPEGEKAGIRWVDVAGGAEKPPEGNGSINKKEADAVVGELRKLINQGYKGTVGVISPFRAQANLIRRLVESDGVLTSQLLMRDYLCETVHKFQGDERDVMIFSPVISRNMPLGSINFLKKTGNLFNVAITRARAMLIVVGNNAEIAKCGISYMENFSKYVQAIDIKKEGVNIKQNDLNPTYPTVNNPERVSEWEHLFYAALYNAGIKTIPQYQEEKYTLDFALFNNKSKLNIEVDGEHYHKDLNGELCYRDQIRNQRMFELGWDVLRFWVYEIRDDMEGCVNKVNDWIRRS